jgi:hypothetical protein
MDLPEEEINKVLARVDTAMPLHGLEHCLESMLGLQHGGLSGLTAYGPNKRQRVYEPPAGVGQCASQPNQRTPRRSLRLQQQAVRRQGRRSGN